jgi:hypothetical protein
MVENVTHRLKLGRTVTVTKIDSSPLASNTYRGRAQQRRGLYSGTPRKSPGQTANG